MLELNWISIFQGSLIIGAILAVFVMVFDEVFCFEGPINFSELVTGITVFGGAGILLSERTNFSMMLIILFAIAIALLVTLAFYYLYLKPMRESENSTAFSIQDLASSILLNKPKAFLIPSTLICTRHFLAPLCQQTPLILDELFLFMALLQLFCVIVAALKFEIGLFNLLPST